MAAYARGAEALLDCSARAAWFFYCQKYSPNVAILDAVVFCVNFLGLKNEKLFRPPGLGNRPVLTKPIAAHSSPGRTRLDQQVSLPGGRPVWSSRPDRPHCHPHIVGRMAHGWYGLQWRGGSLPPRSVGQARALTRAFVANRCSQQRRAIVGPKQDWRLGGASYWTYSNERGEPPHIHVQRERLLAKFWLSPVALASSKGFASHELRMIQQYVDDNRQKFLEAWDEHIGR